MRGKSFGNVASPVVSLGRVSSGAGKILVERRYYTSSMTDTAPSKTSLVTVRCVAAGGPHDWDSTNGVYRQRAGGGGAYARDDLPCSAGQSISISLPSAPASTSNLNASASTVTIGSGTVSAAGGKAGINGGAGGLASDSTGSVKRSGGTGGSGAVGAPGTNGGAGGARQNTFGGGGGAAGDIGDIDSLLLAGDGGGVTAPNGYGGGQSGVAPGVGKGGLIVIEFWST